MASGESSTSPSSHLNGTQGGPPHLQSRPATPRIGSTDYHARLPSQSGQTSPFLHPRFPNPVLMPRLSGPGSQPTDVEILMEKLHSLERENNSLHGRLKEQETLTHKMSQDMLNTNPATVPVIKVTYPTSPRLGIFTGLKPRGGGELDYGEWASRCRQFINESDVQDMYDVTRKIRSSLRGIALEQVQKCTDATDMLRTLDRVYGNLLTEEDQYARFIKLSQEKRESPASFFSRLWSAFSALNMTHQYSSLQANSKIYHTFMSNFIPTDNFLMIEMRARFGAPGETAPDCSSVLTFLRSYLERSGTRTPVTAAAASVATDASECDIDYDKLTDMIMDKLSLKQNVPQSTPQLPTHQGVRPPFSCPRPPFSGSRPRVTPRRGPDFSLPCLHCGELGHWKATCPNPPNPSKVQAAKNRMHAKQAPLNGR